LAVVFVYLSDLRAKQEGVGLGSAEVINLAEMEGKEKKKGSCNFFVPSFFKVPRIVLTAGINTLCFIPLVKSNIHNTSHGDRCLSFMRPGELFVDGRL
jgi:hypothetical protein